MFTISTYAFNIHKDDVELQPLNKALTPKNRNRSWIPISDDFRIIDQFNYDDNEGYFSGSIEMKYNHQTIINKYTPTSDLYDLWNDLTETLFNDSYVVEYLDIPVTITSKKVDKDIKLTVTMIDKYNDFIIPFNEYREALIKEFINFFDHLNHELKRNPLDSPYYTKLLKKYKLFNNN